jgi:TAG lipase/steryl ester hydrolase/phospholipase A2/LPA acyltransferase
MSFLSDTLLPGSSRLHIIGSGASRNGQTALRKSKSHAGLLSPLVQLIRDPLNTIGNAVGGVEYSNRLNSLPEAEVDQREVFKLRLRNVSRPLLGLYLVSL